MDTIRKQMNTATTDSKSNKIVLGDFGNGRFSPAMNELFKDSQRLLGFSEVQAHVTAKQLGVDSGNLNKGTANIKYGSFSDKDKKITLKEATDSIKVNITPSLSVGKVCAELDKLRKVGIKTCDKVVLHDSIMLWINDKAKDLETELSK